MWEDNIYGTTSGGVTSWDGGASAPVANSTSSSGLSWLQSQAGDLLKTASQVWAAKETASAQRSAAIPGNLPTTTGTAGQANGGMLLLLGAVVLLMMAKD